MNAKLLFLTEFRREILRKNYDRWIRIGWTDQRMLQTACQFLERGDDDGWRLFVDSIGRNRELLLEFSWFLEAKDYLAFNGEMECAWFTLPAGVEHLADAERDALLQLLTTRRPDIPDQKPMSPPTPANGAIMYLEAKPGLTGPSRIGRVRRSQTGKTLYYGEQTFHSLRGRGYKANFFEVDSGLEYWISGCRKDGQDTLYPGIVAIDADVREEYWTAVRDRPDLMHVASFRSEGKYSKRRPR